MNPYRTVGAAVALGVAGAALTFLSGAAANRGPEPDVKATANTLVNRCANIKEGDLVLISGQARDQELLEEVAINVRKRGAFPLISVESQKLARRSFDEVPAKFDTQRDEFAVKLAGIVTAAISVEAIEQTSLFADVPPERIAARAKASAPIGEMFLKRNVRTVSLGNGLYPTEATAKLHGLSKDQLATLFWAGVNTDYAVLQSTGEALKSRLAAGSQVRITHPNGTDLKVDIAGRQTFVSDGIISDADAAAGGPNVQVWLPAGEVYLAPTPGSAEGKVIVDTFMFQGKEITGLTLTFKAGKLTDMTAKTGLAPFKARYDAAGTGKDSFGFIDFGINTAIKPPQGSRLLNWVPAGMVTIGVGTNTWAGGTTTSDFDASFFLPGTSVTIDGNALVDKGTLKP